MPSLDYESALMCLATMGKQGREIFNTELMNLLDSAGVRQALRVSWNSQINTLVAI